jgi:hypothetical protein
MLYNIKMEITPPVERRAASNIVLGGSAAMIVGRAIPIEPGDLTVEGDAAFIITRAEHRGVDDR